MIVTKNAQEYDYNIFHPSTSEMYEPKIWI